MLKKHRENLIKLERHLAALPADYQHFDMWRYNSKSGNRARVIDTDCGAVGCAVGHGPAAGVRVRGDLSWDDYCTRVFGVERYSAPFEYLFDARWKHHDNTPQGAAARIRKYIALGGKAPDGWTYEKEKANG